MDIDELRQQLASGKLKITDKSSVIKTGKLTRHSEGVVDFEISHGWSPISAMSCDKMWGAFNIEMLEDIRNQKHPEETLNKILDELHIEDYHWDWFAKSLYCNKDEYEWFFLHADEKIQGACLIYHPKPSEIDTQEIFYIEYVAVAPWNRKNPYKVKEFSGVGTHLILCALGYAVNSLGLTHGFSLLSLPKASAYYQKIGMINFKAKDESPLSYFEMPRETAKDLLGAA